MPAMTCRTFIISTSGKLVYPIAGVEPSKVDFYAQEEQSEPDDIRLLYRIAESQGKILTFNHGPPDWIKAYDNDAINQALHWMGGVCLRRTTWYR